MPYTNQCFLVEVATSTSGSMHTQQYAQVVNFHTVMEIWLGQCLHIIFQQLHWLIQKSLILWFMVDLWQCWSLKYLCTNMSPYCFLHNRNKQYLDKLRLVKTPWVLVDASSIGHWMVGYWLFKLIKSCTLWLMVDLWPEQPSLCKHEPKLIST